MSAFDDVATIPLQQIWESVAGRAVHGERLTLAVIELDANAVIPEHAHDNEQLGLCLSGSLTFRIADESRDLGPGGTWTIPPNVPHEIHVGPAGAAVVDVFSPPRDDWQPLERLPERPPRWP